VTVVVVEFKAKQLMGSACSAGHDIAHAVVEDYTALALQPAA
jgi:hypothetical protein